MRVRDDSMQTVRWGIIGCGDVTEVKSGPGFQKADGSALVAVMRRDGSKARDYALRHGVPRSYHSAQDLIDDGEVDAIYVATPPSSHAELATMIAIAGKPCLVEKPMAVTHDECIRMADAFETRGVPLWVAYYRRALPRFLTVRDLLRDGAIGRVTSVHIQVTARLMTDRTVWRLDPATAGAGLFFDLGSHCVDLLDFLIAPITGAAGFAVNTGGAYAAEDVTSASFTFGDTVIGTGVWNFNAPESTDVMTFLGSEGELRTPIFSDTDVVVSRGSDRRVYDMRNPPHVHQPLIQTIVDELRGEGRCESTGRSGARASWVLEQCVAGYYNRSASNNGDTHL
jgi:1,5-anhydro-D-fructose reductase (1,5-anhydro-D-mannitol-forming)